MNLKDIILVNLLRIKSIHSTAIKMTRDIGNVLTYTYGRLEK